MLYIYEVFNYVYNIFYVYILLLFFFLLLGGFSRWYECQCCVYVSQTESQNLSAQERFRYPPAAAAAPGLAARTSPRFSVKFSFSYPNPFLHPTTGTNSNSNSNSNACVLGGESRIGSSWGGLVFRQRYDGAR